MRSFLLLLTGCFVLSGCVSNMLEQSPAPVTNFGEANGAGSAGVHTVGRGDTVYSISERYKIDMPTIIMVNKLSAPFLLEVGQRLRLPPPNTYKVRLGDTLYNVSRIFGISQTELARKNNLRSPYTLTIGQTLHLPYREGQPKAQTASLQKSGSVPQKIVVPPTSHSRPASVITKKPVEVAKAPSTSKQFKKPSRFMRPVSGKVISSFGPKKNGLHNDGINISATRGTLVKAAADGEVVYAGSALKGYGNLVLVKHGGGYLSAYGHLGKIKVRKGDVLKQGQGLGTVGTSGQVSKPQLHFEIRKGTNAINPTKYI